MRVLVYSIISEQVVSLNNFLRLYSNFKQSTDERREKKFNTLFHSFFLTTILKLINTFNIFKKKTNNKNNKNEKKLLENKTAVKKINKYEGDQ